MKKVAIVGAMSSVGRELLTFFDIDGFSHKNIFAVENKTPLGTQISYGEDFELDVYNLEDFDFSKVDVSIFVCSSEIAKRFIPKAVAKNNKVLDCSGHYALDSEVPLIVAGVNDCDIAKSKKGIVAIPSSITTQLVKPLKQIDDTYQISRIVVSMYISTSYYGNKGMDELFAQTKKIYSNASITSDANLFNKQIAFNVIPQVDDFIGDETKAEWEVDAQVKKIFGEQIKVHANCAFVPSFVGVGQYVNIQTKEDIDIDDVRSSFKSLDGISIFDKNVDGGYFCMADVQGEDNVYISRLRQDVSVENGISFWSVSDNLRAGLAKNAYLVFKLLK